MFLLQFLALAVGLCLVLGVVGFFRSIGPTNRIGRLERQVGELSLQLRDIAGELARVSSGPRDGRTSEALSRASEPSRPIPPAPIIGTSVSGVPPMGAPIAPPADTSVPPISVFPTGASTVSPNQPSGMGAPAGPPPVAPAGPDAPSLEERLGTRWVVWVGGIALGLGALFLVQYSIAEGLLGPFARVLAGGLFAAGLLGAGEWLRRTAPDLQNVPIPSAHIPSVVTAAGTVAAFATVYAAHALYGFIGPVAAFVLLGAVAIGTMLLAALHGPAVAGLGLVASYATPVLVGGVPTSLWPLVLYLLPVAMAAYWLARLRSWLWLAVSAVVGAVVWGVLLVDRAIGSGGFDDIAVYVYILGQLGLAIWLMVLEPNADRQDGEATLDRTGTLVVAAVTGLAAFALFILPSARGGSQMFVVFAFLSTAMLVAAALRTAPAAGLATLAGLIPAAVALGWRGLPRVPDSSQLAPFAQDILRLPDGITSYLGTLALLAGGVSLVAIARLWTGRKLNPGPAYAYALAGVMTPILALILAYLRVTQFDRSIPFAGFAVVVAGGLYLVADRFDNVGDDNKSAFTRFCVGVFAAGCTAAMVFAFAFVLSRGYLTAAFAVAAATTALFAATDKIPALRVMVGAIGVLIVARLAWDPAIMGADVGTWPILNWLLVGYGVPAAAFLYAGRMLKREAMDWPQRLSDALGILFVFLLGFFQIRHALNGGDPLALNASHTEFGLVATLAFGLGLVLVMVDRAGHNSVYRWGSLALGTLSAIYVVLGLGFGVNPLFTGERVGGPPIASTLMLGYLLPAIAATLLARAARGVRPQPYVRLIAITALLLFFGYVTLETRHLFQGERIGINLFGWSGRRTGGAEIWAYSAVWLALGVAFLIYGIARVSLEARLASAALVGLAVVKVFLFDLAGITGLWRALSFIGLGLVLVGIGLLYQRFLFAGTRPMTPQMPRQPSNGPSTV